MSEGKKCSYWEWEDDELPPRIIELICKLKKEKDSLRHEKNILQRRMVDLENYVAEKIEKMKENDDLKKTVADLENLLAVDVGLIQKLKDKVFKQWIIIGISRCCFVGLISSWIM
uniref:Uncharacterized protein n=1 Tax=Nicotiana tabacum TaxID=4097 RepID=A0A1S3X905_TOBAC|nr:PREDICTED: uncharacterized protein LOC107762445 [Nicotiana tabacum]